ncbi:MAG: hypothetical protein HQ541_22895 [Mariniphaga sp.]|nr:hypothetical protein [Mariniphaga sp.]
MNSNGEIFLFNSNGSTLAQNAKFEINVLLLPNPHSGEKPKLFFTEKEFSPERKSGFNSLAATNKFRKYPLFSFPEILFIVKIHAQRTWL